MELRLELVSAVSLVVVEKVLGADAELDQIFVELYLLKNRERGYSQNEIDRK